MEAIVELVGLFHEGGYFAAVGVIVAGWWAYKTLRTDIKKDINEAFEALNNTMTARFDAVNDRMTTRFDSLEKRLDKIDRTLETIQQNYLDHLSLHHVDPMRVEPVNSGISDDNS